MLDRFLNSFVKTNQVRRNASDIIRTLNDVNIDGAAYYNSCNGTSWINMLWHIYGFAFLIGTHILSQCTLNHKMQLHFCILLRFSILDTMMSSHTLIFLQSSIPLHFKMLKIGYLLPWSRSGSHTVLRWCGLFHAFFVKNYSKFQADSTDSVNSRNAFSCTARKSTRAI